MPYTCSVNETTLLKNHFLKKHTKKLMAFPQNNYLRNKTNSLIRNSNICKLVIYKSSRVRGILITNLAGDFTGLKPLSHRTGKEQGINVILYISLGRITCSLGNRQIIIYILGALWGIDRLLHILGALWGIDRLLHILGALWGIDRLLHIY